MNNLTFDIADLPIKDLPILSDEEAGQRFRKWSFVNIYSLNALRDIYTLSKEVNNKTVKSITLKVNENQVKKNIEKKWSLYTERQVLENLNALVKFGLLNYDYSILKKCFEGSEINSDLNENDRNTLKHIFIYYFRFKELSSWFIDPSPEFHMNFDKLKEYDFVEKSMPFYFYSDECKFYNSFLRNIKRPNEKFVIKNDILMRFWDVYIKWGTTLGILDKFNIPKIFNPLKNKELLIAYFIKEFVPFDLQSFISENFNSRNIWIPELILKLVETFRYSVIDIKHYIIENINSNENITFERTSEIFLIKEKTSKENVKKFTYLYPVMDNYYISNLIIRK